MKYKMNGVCIGVYVWIMEKKMETTMMGLYGKVLDIVYWERSLEFRR